MAALAHYNLALGRAEGAATRRSRAQWLERVALETSDEKTREPGGAAGSTSLPKASTDHGLVAVRAQRRRPYDGNVALRSASIDTTGKRKGGRIR